MFGIDCVRSQIKKNIEMQDLLFVLRGFTVWLIIIFAEGLHGFARLILLQPVVGDFRARQAAVFSGILIIFVISYLFIKWIRATNNLRLIAIGFFWLVLTVAFEISLGRFVMQFSWERIFSDYNVINGGLLPFGLLLLMLAPLITAKLKEKLSRRN